MLHSRHLKPSFRTAPANHIRIQDGSDHLGIHPPARITILQSKAYPLRQPLQTLQDKIFVERPLPDTPIDLIEDDERLSGNRFRVVVCAQVIDP